MRLFQNSFSRWLIRRRYQMQLAMCKVGLSCGEGSGVTPIECQPCAGGDGAPCSWAPRGEGVGRETGQHVVLSCSEDLSPLHRARFGSVAG